MVITGKWALFYTAVLGCCFIVHATGIEAQAAGLDRLASLKNPTDTSESDLRISDGIERLLSGAPRVPQAKASRPLGTKTMARLTEADLEGDLRANPLDGQFDAALAEPLFPGTASLQPLKKDLTRFASLGPVIADAKAGGADLLDLWEGSEETGKLVGDPIDLYSDFVLDVNRRTYSVILYGVNGSDRTRLFECRAGLGSPDYPTPTGTYYLLRIYDDHPLWIPPQDRDWAYGMAPSHSVYGGHMLPLFIKKQARRGAAERDGEVVDDLDCVAPAVEMVDSGGYRVHGTDSPWSIGSSQSHGCVRLLNSSVKKLADTLKMYAGTTYRDRSPNGPYINLARPVKIVLHN
jgi:hypothetical protein